MSNQPVNDVNRARMLEKQRQIMEEDFRRKREEISKESVQVGKVGERFTSQKEDFTSALAKDTVGLVTLSDFQRKERELKEKRDAELVAQQQRATEEALMGKKKAGSKQGQQRKERIAAKTALSFSFEEGEGDEEEKQKPPQASPQEEKESSSSSKKNGDEKKGDDNSSNNNGEIDAATTTAATAANEEERNGLEEDEVGPAPNFPHVSLEPVIKRAKISKNPSVDTSFLPDREREAQELEMRAQLAAQWRIKQEAIKNEIIEITYSFWDGSGHRNTVKCRKGDTIAMFLDKARAQFPELRGVSVDNLMYVKEDVIMPHDKSFYDFIVNQARGKSGPLFHFDVHEDVRMINDTRVERDDSHAGKVVERHWYDKFKHIFPASRWEVFDPQKDYGTYTVADRYER